MTLRKRWFSTSGGGMAAASPWRSWMMASKQSLVASLTRSMGFLKELGRGKRSAAHGGHGEQLDGGVSGAEGVGQVEGDVALAHHAPPATVLRGEREVGGAWTHRDLGRRPVG